MDSRTSTTPPVTSTRAAMTDTRATILPFGAGVSARTTSALIQLSLPAGKPVAGWKHAVLLYLHEHMDAEYEEIIDWTEEMERIRFVLGFQRGEFPAPSTLCKVFKRTPMSVWRQLLRRSAELLD
jgi:hypothetical protein